MNINDINICNGYDPHLSSSWHLSSLPSVAVWPTASNVCQGQPLGPRQKIAASFPCLDKSKSEAVHVSSLNIS